MIVEKYLIPTFSSTRNENDRCDRKTHKKNVGLDPVMRDEILDIFNDFTRDESHAILISSHIVSDLEKICDYVAFLHKGNLVLFEEKDRLLEKYGIIQCTKEQIQELDQSAVIGVKYSSYNVEAVVLRDQIPKGTSTSHEPRLTGHTRPGEEE